MQDLVDSFISSMSAVGCAPLHPEEIKADDTKHRYRVEGDTIRQKTGCYCLKVDGDFAVGFFINYRLGEFHSWHSKTNKKFTPEERTSWKARIDAERAVKEKERTIASKAAAEKSIKLWRSAKLNGESDYLKRKGLSEPHGARFMRNLLVIAAFKNGKPVTLQFIAPNGDKVFLKDSEKQGAYFPLAKAGEDLSTLILCEGYSTAASIREATGLPVVSAFDANNLKPVAEILRKKYPESEIIIAADNDAWSVNPKFRPKHIDPKKLVHDDPKFEEWRIQGYMKNTGVEAGQQAAVAIGGARVVIPRFKDTSSRPSDFNDLYLLEGKDAVKRLFDKSEPDIEEEPTSLSDAEILEYHAQLPIDEEAAAQVQLYIAAPEKRETDTDWKSKLVFKADGSLKGNSLTNALLFIEHDKVLKNIFCFDSFACEMTVYQCPPWEDAEKFKPRPLQDTDETQLTGYMEKFGVSVGIQIIKRTLHAVVKKNSKNPAKEFFNNLKWDGIKRLDTWLQDYCGVRGEPNEYVSAIGRKWLCASVARVRNPGTKFDHMLILEGPQRLGKSSLLRELGTVHGRSYFDDTITIEHLMDNRTVPRLQGKLILEIAELSGIRRADVDRLKNVITIQEDEIILKYENNKTQYPRQFIFGGTINPQEGIGYLSDPTGNTRFWPVSTTKIDLIGIKNIKEQLWAEAAVVSYEEKLYLDTPTLQEMHAEVVAMRLSEHPWTSEVAEFCRGKRSVYKAEIWEHLNIGDRTKRTQSSLIEIGRIMGKLGFKNKQVRVGGEREYVWVRDIEDEEVGF